MSLIIHELGKKHTLTVLDAINNKPITYLKLAKILNMHSKILSDSISILLEYDLITRRKRKHKTLKINTSLYSVTDKGKQILECILLIEELIKNDLEY